MGLNDTIRAGQIAALEQIKAEGRVAVDAAENEYRNRIQELKDKLATYMSLIEKVDTAIKNMEQGLKAAQDALKMARAALQTAQAELSACPRGSSAEKAASSRVAKCSADVKMWESRCHKLFEALQRYRDTKSKLEKARDELVLLIGKLEKQRPDRTRFDENQIDAVMRHQSVYPGGR